MILFILWLFKFKHNDIIHPVYFTEQTLNEKQSTLTYLKKSTNKENKQKVQGKTVGENKEGEAE